MSGAQASHEEKGPRMQIEWVQPLLEARLQDAEFYAPGVVAVVRGAAGAVAVSSAGERERARRGRRLVGAADFRRTFPDGRLPAGEGWRFNGWWELLRVEESGELVDLEVVYEGLLEALGAAMALAAGEVAGAGGPEAEPPGGHRAYALGGTD